MHKSSVESMQSWVRPRQDILAWPYGWQTPAITEQHAYVMACQGLPALGGAAYIGFPWATLIDILDKQQNDKARPFMYALQTLPVIPVRRRITVAQHILARDHIRLFRMAGITDVFWSHATGGDTGSLDMRLHPFPLYPVQCVGVVDQPGHRPIPLSRRRYLYSFVGLADHPGYLTPVRKWITRLPARSDACVQERAEWHYQHAVYGQQIFGRPEDRDIADQRDTEAAAYRAVLADSVFSLCPSGTGPNSIRLWESLGFGCIPVILSDTLGLPGDPELWLEAAIQVPETELAVAHLPQQLEQLAADPDALARKQKAVKVLWERYGAGDFIHDVRQCVSGIGTGRETLLGQANRALEQGQYALAIEVYSRAMQVYPELAHLIGGNMERAKRKLRAAR
jgi:hypothetical protein